MIPDGNFKKVNRMVALFVAAVSALVVSLPTQSALAAPIPPRIWFIGAQGHYVVADGAPIGTVVGAVRANAVNLSAVISYSISEDSGVAVNSTTGVLTITETPTGSVNLVRPFEISATDGVNNVQAIFNLLVMPSSTLTHGISEEMWDEMKGTRVDDAKIATENRRIPTNQSVLPQINRKFDLSNYSARYSGFLVAPTTGAYTFHISADDSAALWIGSNASASSFGTKPIATQSVANYQFDWGAGTSQQSAPVNLVAGQVYALKVVHKESYYWGDHVAVAWKAPGMTAPVNGSSANLIPESALYPVTAIDWSPPPKPAHATVSKITSTTTTLSWRPVVDISGIDRYTVWRDSRKIAEIPADGRTNYVYNDLIGIGLRRYSVHAIDGKGNISAAASFLRVATGSAYDSLEKAVASGDASLITDTAALISAAQAEIAKVLVRQNDIISNLYTDVESVSYLPASSAGPYGYAREFASDRVIPIVRSNNTVGTVLAVAGTSVTESRFSVFGDSPLTAANSAAANRLMSWLMTGDGAAPKSPTFPIAILNGKSSAIKSWLILNGFGTDSSISECTASNFTTCFAGKSLIISDSRLLTDDHAPAMVLAVQEAMQKQVPILWTGDKPWEHGKTQQGVFDLLEVEHRGSAYWHQAVYESKAAVTAMTALTNQFEPLSTMLAHFAADDWNVDFTGWDCMGCSSNPTAQAYITSEFNAGAIFLRSRLNDLDLRGVSIFAAPPSVFRLLKILVLLGDVYRRDVSFPAPPTKVTNSRFFRTYFSDFSAYNVRTQNPAQPDLGSFAWPIPDSTPRFDDVFTYETKADKYFTAVGAYAHPGQSFTVTRTDSFPVTVELGINTVRPTSTHEFTTYVRPKYLRTPFIVLKPGVPITITSPYGGPLQIQVGASDPAVDVAISLTNVGRHPVWDGPQTTASFTKGIADAVYNWTEIKTPGIEIHSIRRLMLDTLQGPAFNTPEKLSESTFKYHFQSQYGVAGFTGSGLPVSDTVQRLCTDNGLDCSNRLINKVPSISHFNADKGSCGYGCSGNPYDADWSYSVIGWGDSHEIGHNIARFLLYDTKTSETANDIYSAHTLGKWNKEVPYFWQGAAFSTKPEVTFSAIVAAQASADPVTYMKDVAWGTDATAAARGVTDMQWDVQRMHFYWHLVQQSRENTRVNFGNDGWDFWTLMNAMDREFYYAKSDATRWNARRTALGFGGLSQEAASVFSASNLIISPNNSRTLVQASRLAKTDQRPFFDMWGVTYSQEASDQVASFNYPPAEKKYWYYPTTFDGSSYFSGVAAGSVPVDGSTTSLPKVPIAFNFTDADISSQVYPWPQQTRVAVRKSIALRTAVGTAATVEFKANGVVIPECNAVPTQTHDWTKPTGSPAGGAGGGAKEVVATCNWFPQVAGSFEITTNVTATALGWGQAVTSPVTIEAYNTDDYPIVTSVSSSNGLEGSTVILRGFNLKTISKVTYHGVDVPVISRSAARVTLVLPSVTSAQVNDVFTLSTSTGYRVVTPHRFIIVKPVLSVSLGSTAMIINPGKVVSFSPTVLPSYATNQTLRWRSSNSAVATVSSTGRMVALRPGTTTISVISIDSARTDAVSVTVTTDAVAEVSALSVQPVSVDLGSTMTAQFEILPTNSGLPVLSWSSANTAIAQVNAAGRVTGVAVGNTTVTATAPNGVSKTVAATVNVPAIGDDLNNTVSGLTTQMQYSKNNGLTWSTYSGAAPTQLTGNIVLKIRKVGTTSPVKSLLFTDGTNSLANPATTVVAGNVYLSDLVATSQTSGWGPVEPDSSNKSTGGGDGLNLQINDVTYAKGLGVHAASTITYNLAGKYARFKSDIGADDSDVGSVGFQVLVDDLSLHSSTTLRKVDGAKSLDIDVRGATTLTLIVNNGGNGGSSDHADWAGARLVPAVSAVAISPTTAAVFPGTKTTLTGTPVTASGVSTTLTWSSSDNSVATVDSAGEVTGVAIGLATITATSSIGGVIGTSVVRVGAPKVTSLSLPDESMALSPSGSGTLIATVVKDVGASVSLVWTSSDPAVATVDSTGGVQAGSTGSTVVTVATADGEFEASVVVTVSQSEAVTNGLTSSIKSVIESVEKVFDGQSPEEPAISVRGGSLPGSSSGVVEFNSNLEQIFSIDASASSHRRSTPANAATLRVEVVGKYVMIRSLTGTAFRTGATIKGRYLVGKKKLVFTCVVTGAVAAKPKTRCLMPKALQKAVKQRRAVFQIRIH